MELRSDENKLTFIVDNLSSFFFPKSGGSMVSHKLAYELARRGNYVYVFNEPKYYHENIRVIPTQAHSDNEGWSSNYVWEGISYNPERTVSIYTQVTWGNPLNTTNNVRWILHDCSEEHWKTFGENDHICNFGTFKVPDNVNQSVLTTFDYRLDEFKNNNNPNRKGFAHLIHKNTPDWGLDFIEKFGSKEIPQFNGRKEFEGLNDEFNKYEYLLTFDDKSYYTTIAALCGCKVIILNPDKNKTPHQYRMENPIQMCGVACGFDDIEWANKTIDLVRNNLIQLEMNDNKTIDFFVSYWTNKLIK